MSIVVIIGIITYTVKGTLTFAQASMALFTLPNTVIMVSALAFFGSFAAVLPPDLPLAFLPQGFTSLTESFTLVDDLPFWGWIIVLAAFLSLLISALLVGIGRPRTATFGWKRVGLLPAVSLPLWVGAIYLVANVHFFGSIGFSGSAGIALSSGVHLAVAMLAVSVLAEFLPFALHRISPAIVVMLCGKERTDVWLSGQDATPPQSDPVLGEPGASVAPPLPASQAMDPTLKKRLVSALVLAGVFAVLAMGAGIAVKILNSSRTADIAVAQYAQALAAGNAELANAMIDPGIRSDDRALLSTEVVTSATEKLSVVGVAVEEENPVASVVQVTYSLDGEHFTEEYLATPGPKEYGVLNTWKLSGSPTKTITIHSPRFSQVRVNGVAIEVPHDQQHVEVKVYPGIYTVSAPVATYLTAADTEVRVGPTSSQPVVELKPEPTQALRDKILQEAQDYVASCASSPGNLDLSCPYQVQNPRLDKLELTPSVSSIELDESLHFTTDKAAITLREKPGFFVNNPKDKLIEFTVRGGVIVDDPQNPEILLSSGW